MAWTRTGFTGKTVRRIGLTILLLAVWIGTCALSAQEETEIGTAEWRSDIDFLVRSLESTHPNPYTRTSRDAFHADVAKLIADLPGLTDGQTAVRLMQLVASLRDGHTTLEASAAIGFDHWFPVRFYRFTDGVFITAIDVRQRRYVGAKVERIGRLPAVRAAELVSTLQGSDNEFGAMEEIFLLSNAAALQALGIIDTIDVLPLEVVTREGWRETLPLQSVRSDADLGWRFRGEMFGPPVGDSIRLVTAFGDREALDFRKRDPALPLHLRYRLYYDFTFVPEADAVYVQFNFVQDDPQESFRDFTQRLFRFVDGRRIDRFILDLRYNSGGDGSMLLPFVHDLIKRDETVNRPGHFFTLVGRKTFSAAVMLLADLQRHTSTVLVGEPAGAPRNHFGDAAAFVLPNSGMRLSVSTLYWQLSTSDDTSRVEPIDIPAPFSSRDYFSGRDPALEAALADEAFQPIPAMLHERGGEIARIAYEERSARWAQYAWWRPFDRATLNTLGYSLLEESRVADAVIAFELNAARFPDDWRVWDSLGDGYATAGRNQDAVRCFERALTIAPDSPNAEYQRRRTAELGGSVPP